MRKEDFLFIGKMGDGSGVNEDYWYETSVTANKELSSKYSEVVCVPVVIYVKTADLVFIKKVSDSKVDFIECTDNGLHTILKELSQGVVDGR